MKLEKEEVVFKVFSYIIISLFALTCIIPVIMIISGSFTDERQILLHGYSLWPAKFSLRAYTSILKDPTSIVRSYGVTIGTTVIGTGISLLFTSMGAYVLARKDFRWRNTFAYIIYFTTLFNGGLTPWYILMCKIGMKNNIAVLVIPTLFSVFNILIFRNFINGIPFDITESGKIDGANDLYIFFKLILPLTKPALATIGLFTALAYWNQWYNAMLFLSDEKLYPLQYFLYNMINNAEALKNIAQAGVNIDASDVIPSETVKLSMTIIVTGPIVLVYPFVQKYFVKGMIVGAVKG